MKKSSSKSETIKQLEDFFSALKSHTPKEIKKIKRLAMAHKIRLKEKRKLFCGKCFSPNLKVAGIKKGIKKIECLNCGRKMRWKVK